MSRFRESRHLVSRQRDHRCPSHWRESLSSLPGLHGARPRACRTLAHLCSCPAREWRGDQQHDALAAAEARAELTVWCMSSPWSRSDLCEHQAMKCTETCGVRHGGEYTLRYDHEEFASFVKMLRDCWLLVLLVVPALVASATYKAEGVPWPKVPHIKRVPLLYRHANLPQPDVQRQGRIVGGIVASRGQFKYQVALMIDGSVLCGGALVSDRVVLTAAQCAVGHTSFQAHLGAQQFYNNNEPGRQIITSVDVRIHEQYNSANFNNDIALIRLPTPAVTSQYVEAVEMASATGGDFAGQSATISGWGTLVDGSYTISNELRYNTVNIISNAECTDVYGPDVVTAGVICQSGADVGSPCLGDSGTGMTVTAPNGRPTLVGISSFISKTEGCQGSHPAGFIRISEYRDWIATNSP